jgi:hypothetical protein
VVTVAVDENPLHAVEAAYCAMYEAHCEAEQIARLEGDDTEADQHHAAVLVIVRALTAEGVPT